MIKENISTLFSFFLVALAYLVIWNGCSRSNNKEKSSFRVTENKLQLTQETASGFARLALKCIHKEYPNKLDHVINNPSEVQSPRTLHPAFYGCFDWHSSVHGHWMLVHLLRLFPDLPEANEIRLALNRDFSAENIIKEVQYLGQKNRKSFERTYGWAWLLKLAEELHNWNDPDGQRWSKNLLPLTQAIVKRYLDFLPRQTYPIRRGVHANTAFGIGFALDYARAVGDEELETMLVKRSLAYYEKDKNYPALWEPNGDDFFSPCLMEADLMRRLMNPTEFRNWFHRFLPDIVNRGYKNLLEPAIVSDRSDPKLVHLDGLNLSRAWCMVGIASALPFDDPVRKILIQSAIHHAESGIVHVASGNYGGEHWLASFAVYMFSMLDQ